jgi:nitroimidazol reductase NimA-like FMN-containing flavoprotein (pyridoxamine 5'-phosphate oxidase superfamily)
MRRSDYSSQNKNEINEIAQNCIVGNLGIIDSNQFPRVVPLNFVYSDDCIYFHGANEGEKFDVFKANPKVSFSIVEPYSLIPSYWIAKDYACPATQFYKSIYFIGIGKIEFSVEKKASILELFMQKYQPEGRYKTITTKDSLYTKALDEVNLFKIVPKHIDLKFKFGQNMSLNKRKILIGKLEDRQEGIDLKTAVEIQKTLSI